MKKYLLVFSIFATVSAAFAMSYYPGKYGAEESARNLKWTKCSWGNNVNFETVDLPGKPGPSDSVTVRPGAFTFELDGNFNVLSFHTGDGSHSFAKGRTLRFKNFTGISIPCSNASVTRQDWEKCTIETAAYNVSFWHEGRAAGRAVLTLINSKMTVKNSLVCTIPANPIIKNAARAGVEIACIGDTNLSFGGIAVIDPIIVDQNDEWMFKWTFSDKDGKVPHVFFQRKADFDKCDIEFSISDKIKSGKYALLEFQDRKSGVGTPRSITLNDQEYKFGDTFKLGKRTAKISLAAFGRDSSTPNDVVLEIGK